MAADVHLHAKTARQSHTLLYVAALIGILFVAFTLLFRLDTYPAPWHDEGAFLRVAKNYAENGIYAGYSSEGNRYSGAIVSTGPTVIMPIALLFKIFGPSIIAGRLVIIAYALLTLGATYLLAESLMNRRAALVAAGLMLLCHAMNFQYHSRTVLGEVPALFFVMIGLWLWLRPGERSLWALVGVGLLFGAAAITKNQYAAFILPGVLIAWLLDLFWYRQRGWLFFVVPGALAGLLFGGWTYYILFLHDAHLRDVAADMQALRENSAQSFLQLKFATIKDNLVSILGPRAYGGLMGAALLFTAILGLRKTREGQAWGIITLFALINLATFTVSLGWDRYAFPGLALAALPVARLIYSLTDGYRFDWAGLRAFAKGQEATPATLITIIVVVALFGIALLPLSRILIDPLDQSYGDGYEMAAYIDANIPETALIETWEDELGVMTDHNYHIPPQRYENYTVSHDAFGGASTSAYYDFRTYVDPDYVIDGWFSKLAEVYAPEQLENYELVETIGRYDLYRRVGLETAGE